MKTSDFYYDLPEELIAQTPVEPRNSSRLMVLPRNGRKIEHKHFYDLPEFLKPGDCLVLNNTRVLPARLYGTREDTGAVVEFVLLRHMRRYVINYIIHNLGRLAHGKPAYCVAVKL